MSKSTIEWTDYTWNPMHGCTKVKGRLSACDICYAEKMALRNQGKGSQGYENGFAVTLRPERLYEPYGYPPNVIVFVCSMGDIFHPKVPFEFIDQVMETITDCDHNIFMLLTKRPEIMAKYFATRPVPKNVWVGTTVENQRTTSRIKFLQQVKSSVRFISAEPLFEDIDFNFESMIDSEGNCEIDYVLIGGASGAGATAMKPSWAKSALMQCLQNNVAVHFKQWGTFGPDGQRRNKASNGRVLCGREWNELPVAKHYRLQQFINVKQA